MSAPMYPPPQPANRKPTPTWLVLVIAGVFTAALCVSCAVGTSLLGRDDESPGALRGTTSTTTTRATTSTTEPTADAPPPTSDAPPPPPVTEAPPSPPPVEEPPAMTVSQENAVETAQSYLDYTSFSRQGLIDQLEFEGYSTEDATFAVDYLSPDWFEQAAKTAQSYLDYTSFSRQGLIDQLLFEGFTQEQAEYGVNAVGL